MSNFTQLHLHSSYSLNSGTVKIDDLIIFAKKNKIRSLAVTDYINIFSAVKFYQKCIQSSIKPIIGCEIPLLVNNTHKLDNIILLCQNIDGYHNLNKILSHIHTSRSSHLGASLAILEKYNSHLICLSGGRNGVCGLSSLNKSTTEIKVILNELSRVFTSRFYMEIDRTERQNESFYHNNSLSLASELNIPVVATNDVLFLSDADYDANEVKVAINQKTKLDERANQADYSPNQYFKTEKEMISLFSDILLGM